MQTPIKICEALSGDQAFGIALLREEALGTGEGIRGMKQKISALGLAALMVLLL